MMFDFLKKKEKKASNGDNKFIMSAALLIHAAKIDQNFTEKEKTICLNKFHLSKKFFSSSWRQVEFKTLIDPL